MANKCPTCGTRMRKDQSRCPACGRETKAVDSGRTGQTPKLFSQKSSCTTKTAGDSRSCNRDNKDAAIQRKKRSLSIAMTLLFVLVPVLFGLLQKFKSGAVEKYYILIIAIVTAVIPILQIYFQQYIARIDYPEKLKSIHEEAELLLDRILSPQEHITLEVFSVKPSAETLLALTPVRMFIIEKLAMNDNQPDFRVRALYFRSVDKTTRNPLSGNIDIGFTAKGKLVIAVPDPDSARTLLSEIDSRKSMSTAKTETGNKPALIPICITCGEETDGGRFCEKHK